MISEKKPYNKLSGKQRFLRNLSRKLTYFAFRPKLFYENEALKETAFETPSILIANHTFAFNGAVIGTLLKNEEICFLMAKDLFENRLLTEFYSAIGCVPIDRQNTDTAWLHKSKEIINEGKHICIFPEGKVSKDDETKAFKPGFIILAAVTGVPIVPMCIIGKRRFFITRQRLIVGKPMYIDKPEKGLTKDYLDTQTQRYRNEVLKLKNLYYTGGIVK